MFGYKNPSKINSVYLLKGKKLDEAGDVRAEVFSLLHSAQRLSNSGV